MKVLYFDTETTGLDCKYHEITQLAYILEADGAEIVRRSLHMRPLHPERADPEALAIQGTTLEELSMHQHPFSAYREFIGDLSGFIDKYDKKDKAFPSGYNGRFDLDFLSEWFKGIPDPYLGSWINWKLLDPMNLMHWQNAAGIHALENYKLGTVAQYHCIGMRKAHDALSDVEALRDLVHLCLPTIQPCSTGGVQ